MSQAKVDKYKIEKANRKDTMAKEKRRRFVLKICGGVVAIALVAWIATSVATAIYDNRPAKTIYCNMTEITNYLDSISDVNAK